MEGPLSTSSPFSPLHRAGAAHQATPPGHARDVPGPCGGTPSAAPAPPAVPGPSHGGRPATGECDGEDGGRRIPGAHPTPCHIACSRTWKGSERKQNSAGEGESEWPLVSTMADERVERRALLTKERSANTWNMHLGATFLDPSIFFLSLIVFVVCLKSAQAKRSRGGRAVRP